MRYLRAQSPVLPALRSSRVFSRGLRSLPHSPVKDRGKLESICLTRLRGEGYTPAAFSHTFDAGLTAAVVCAGWLLGWPPRALVSTGRAGSRRDGIGGCRPRPARTGFAREVAEGQGGHGVPRKEVGLEADRGQPAAGPGASRRVGRRRPRPVQSRAAAGRTRQACPASRAGRCRRRCSRRAARPWPPGNSTAPRTSPAPPRPTTPSGKWGLFDDTPNALLKDVQAAVVKAQKAEADQLVKQAKALMAKTAPGSEAERAANLDQALQMAQRADQLHGPYSAWDLGDRPDKLVKDDPGRARQAQERPARDRRWLRPMPARCRPPARPAVAAERQYPGVHAGRRDDRRNARSQRPQESSPRFNCMAEGRKLADQRNFAAARAKYMEADRLRVAFSANEYNPGFALQDLNTRGIRDIEAHVAESHKMIAKKDYAKADAEPDRRRPDRGVARALRPAGRGCPRPAPHRLGRQVRRPRADRDDPGPAPTRSSPTHRSSPIAGDLDARARKPVVPATGGRYRPAAARPGRLRVQARRPRHGRPSSPCRPTTSAASRTRPAAC